MSADAAGLGLFYLPKTKMTRRRFAAGAIADGRQAAGAATTKTIYSLKFPSTPDERETLPEGKQSGDAITLFTKADLRALSESAGTVADQVDVDGKTYEVSLDANWIQFGFKKYIATVVPL